MLKDITLGQFFPGHSAIHRMDPRTKLILTMVYRTVYTSTITAMTTWVDS